MKEACSLVILLIAIYAGKDRYDLRHEKIVNDLGEYRISIEDDKIVFDSSYGKIDAPLHYKRNLDSFNFDGCYKIVSDSHPYYFHFGWMEFKNATTIFSNVKWLGERHPPNGKYQILTVDLKLKQHGSISICTIGDSQTWWNEANNLRLYLNDEYPELYFTGSRVDINGYPHEGEGGNHTNQVLARIEYIPEASYYTLLLGTNDWQQSADSAVNNIIDICKRLLEKYPSCKVLYLTPIPTTNQPRDKFNLRLQDTLVGRLSTNKKILIVDTGGKMRQDSAWQTKYISDDGLHQSAMGTHFMAQIIADAIRHDRTTSSAVQGATP
jgi:lysophospholipase L1-like esterase